MLISVKCIVKVLFAPKGKASACKTTKNVLGCIWESPNWTEVYLSVDVFPYIKLLRASSIVCSVRAENVMSDKDMG